LDIYRDSDKNDGRDKKGAKRKDGAARMCIGVGQGIVMVVEKPL
jgi:acetyl-CoA acetyltransferase